MSDKDLEFLLDQLTDLIIKSESTLVFSGAGHSTESGIPDFRSPGGIWTKYDPEDFTYQKFVSSRESRKRHWHMLGAGDGLVGRAVEPNPAHYAVAELERLGKLDCVITQNVDGLHQRAGNSPNRVFELHGNMQWAVCLGCRKRYPFEQIKVRLDKGEEIPDCEVCHGI